MKMYYINLKRSPDRLESMETGFSEKEDLVRVEGIDGRIWASKNEGEGENPTWKKKSRSKCITDGILEYWSTMPPNHLACNQSHRKAVKAFLDSGDPIGVIAEDDIEPTDTLRKAWENGKGISDILDMADGFDVKYLCGTSHRPWRVKLFLFGDFAGQIRKVRTLMAYAITRKGAEAFMASTSISCYLADSQFPLCSFESFAERTEAGISAREKMIKDRNEKLKNPKDGKIELVPWISNVVLDDKIKATAFEGEGLVRLSSLSENSLLGH